MSDRRRLRGRGQRVRLEGRERPLLRPERGPGPALAALAREGWSVGVSPGLERAVVRVDGGRQARRTNAQVRRGRGCLRQRAPAGPPLPAAPEVRLARRDHELHRGHPPFPSLRGGLHDEADQPAGRNGHAPFVRRGCRGRDGGRRPHALGWPVPVRRARRGGRQRHQGRSLVSDGGRTRSLRHSSAGTRTPGEGRGRGRTDSQGDRLSEPAAAARETAGTRNARQRNRPQEVLPARRGARPADAMATDFTIDLEKMLGQRPKPDDK